MIARQHVRSGSARCSASAVALLVFLVPATSRADHLARVRFEVSPQGLRVRGALYGRTIARSALVVAGAQVVDLDTVPSLHARFKLNGIGLPHYQSGWFRLRNGETALLFVRRPALAVYVPTTLGYPLLLTPDQPQAFVAALRNPGASVQTFAIAPAAP